MHKTVSVPKAIESQEPLASLGLQEQWLSEIGSRIVNAYSQATPHDAAFAAGIMAYLEAVRIIRDILCPKGWEATRKNHLELVTLPDKNIHILVSSGNKYVGNPNIEPSTKNPKGKQTKRVVYSNIKHSYLFPEMNEPVLPEVSGDGQTWFLLYHIDLKNKELRMEISLPKGFDDTYLKVHSWEKRIILPAFNFEASGFNLPELEFTTEVDFEIIKKSNG